MMVIVVVMALGMLFIVSIVGAILVAKNPQWLTKSSGGGAGGGTGGGGGASNINGSDFVPVAVRDRGGNVSGLGVSGRAPPIVDWEGKKAFKVTYRAGQIHPSGTDCNMSLTPPGMFPTSQCRVSFKLWVADNFAWTKTKQNSVGGKLGGFTIGFGDHSGSNYSTTGASFRLTFKDNGMANGYLYPQLRKASRGDSSLPWSALDQSEALRSVSTVNAGISVWRHNTALILKKQQWNTIEMFCRLNTPGKYDGVLELVINGVKATMNQTRYRYDAATLISRYDLGTFFGGGNISYAPPSTTYAYFADYSFSKT